MAFRRSLSDSKSPQISRTLLSILAVVNNVVVWMVSTRPPTSKSSSPFNNPLVTVPDAPIIVGIFVTSMFHSFFNSLAWSRYLSFFSHSFSFILWSAGTAKSTILQVFFFFLLIIIKSGLLAGIRWSVCMLKSRVFHISVSWLLINIWMIVSLLRMGLIRPFVSNSTIPLFKSLGTVPSAPITTDIAVTLMFSSFQNCHSCLTRFKYVCLFSLSFIFNLWSTAKILSIESSPHYFCVFYNFWLGICLH